MFADKVLIQERREEAQSASSRRRWEQLDSLAPSPQRHEQRQHVQQQHAAEQRQHELEQHVHN